MKRLVKLLGSDDGADKIERDPEITQGLVEQIKGAAVDRGRSDDMIARLGDIGDTDEGRCLSGSCQHRADAAFERGDLARDGVEGGIRQTGVEAAVRFQVEQLAHGLGAVVNKGRALNDRQNARFAVLRFIACLYAFCIDFHIIYLQKMINIL